MTFSLAVQIIASLLSIYTLLWSFKRMNTPKIHYFLLLALAVFLYATGYMIELSARSLEAAYTARRMENYGVCSYAVLLYLFIRDYTNRPVEKGWKLALLFVIPAINLFSSSAYPVSRLYYADIQFNQATSRMVVERGPLLYLYIVYSLVFTVLCAIEIALRFSKKTRDERTKRRTFLLAAVLPIFSILVFALKPVPVLIQAGSVSLVVAQLIWGRFILHHCAQDWLPFARESVVEHMGDGYALVDRENRLLDINEMAAAYFHTGEMARDVPVSEIPGFPMRLLRDNNQTQEFALQAPGGEIWLQASATPIWHDGKLVCTCVLFYDITERKKRIIELEDLAAHDALTGLHNRGSFFRLAGRDFALHLRTGQPASVLMLDIDHFKRVNDTHGHQAGDVVLVEVAKLLLRRLRHTDLGGRYGGEEFSAFLPATDEAGALYIAETIRGEVEKLAVCSGDAEIRITVSIGVATLDKARHSDLSALLADADVALYSAKKNGRNRVVLADSTALSAALSEKKAQ